MENNNFIKKNKLYKILSIDGGGIRGIIPALVLVEIEKRTGKPIHEIFDLVAGTSTGGIIAVGLNIPDEKTGKARYVAKDVVKLFQNRGQIIFLQDTWRSIMTGLGLLEERYSHEGLLEVLEDYCGDLELKCALTDVLLTSYDLNSKKPFFFKSRLAKQLVKENFKMKHVIRATTAAPTYFEPLQLLSMADSHISYSLVDGGIVANNPAMCAFAEAVALNHSNILIVSLGTGDKTEEISYKDAVNWGIARWFRPLLTLMMNGNNDTVDYQLKEIFAARQGSYYYRLQINLPKENIEFDNTTPENINILEKKAEDLIIKENNNLEEICRLLTL